MKTLLATLLICSTFAFLSSCSQEIVETKEEMKVVPELKDTISEVLETPKVKIETFEDYIEDFILRTKIVQQQLINSTPEQANKLYLEFRKKNQMHSEQLTSLASKMLDDYNGLYDDTGELKYNGKYGAKIKQLFTAGLEPWYVGEGMTEIRVRPFEYDHLFRGFLTPDFESYMQNTLLDEQFLITNDGGLSISWQQLGEYIIRWERFIYTYPKSSLKKNAKEIYKDYQLMFLFGLDNTPVYEYSTGEINDENIFEFNRMKMYFGDNATSELSDILMQTNLDFESKQNAVIKRQTELLRKM